MIFTREMRDKTRVCYGFSCHVTREPIRSVILVIFSVNTWL